MEVVRIDRSSAGSSELFNHISNTTNTTRLPSWGDPILPEVWIVPEEEMNEKFPLPGLSLSLEDQIHDCCTLKVPYVDDNDEIRCLYKNQEDTTAMKDGGTSIGSTVDDTTMRSTSSSSGCCDVDDNIDLSINDRDVRISTDMIYSVSHSIDGYEIEGVEVMGKEVVCPPEPVSPYKYGSSREPDESDSDDEDDDDVSLNSFGSNSESKVGAATTIIREFVSNQDDMMDTEQDDGFSEHVQDNMDSENNEVTSGVAIFSSASGLSVKDEEKEGGDDEEKPSPAEWVIEIVEVETNANKRKLRFKLKTKTGVAMTLFPSEVISSVSAIMDDEFEGILFEIRRSYDNEPPVIVDSSKVIRELRATITLRSKNHETAYEKRDGPHHEIKREEDKEQHHQRLLRVPAFIRRRKESSSTSSKSSSKKKKTKHWNHNHPRPNNSNKNNRRFGFTSMAWRAISGRRSKNRPGLASITNHQVE